MDIQLNQLNECDVQILNVSPRRVDLYCRKNSTGVFVFSFKDEYSSYINITGYVFHFKLWKVSGQEILVYIDINSGTVRASSGKTSDITISNASEGQITFRVGTDLMQFFQNGETLQYQIVCEKASDFKYDWVVGFVQINE